jgi:DNA-binding NarL/FixJ family response regulator
MRCTSVVIADRHPVLLQGLNRVLGAEPDFNIVASCGAGADCIDAIRKFGPDIAIVDAAMPGLTGLKILSLVNSNRLSTQVVFFAATVEDCELVTSAAVNGYSIILKDVVPKALVQSLRRIAGGQRLLPSPSSDQPGSRTEVDEDDADYADGPRAADYASGFRRTIEQGNRATAEYCRRHHQGASSQHLSKARNQ